MSRPSNATGTRAAIVAVLMVSAMAIALPSWASAPPTKPMISSFSPTSGPVGTSVTITGTNLTGATSVTFNGVSATFTGVSSTQIKATVPSGAKTGKICVTTPGGTDCSSQSFTVTTAAAKPMISSFSPTSGPVGTSVTITGTNLTGATSVTFNGVSATFTGVSSTQIKATVPSGAKTGKICVTTPGGTDCSSQSFTVTTVGAPTIASFTPTYGPVGTTITITGTNFTGTTSVTFNGIASTFNVVSSTKITATVPAGATTGPIKVTTPGGSVTSTTRFTVSTTHTRSVTLKLRKQLVARGVVSASDGFTACVADVPVKIQRRVSGQWKTVGSTTTGGTGTFEERIPDKPGKYRAKAPKVTLNAGADVCSGARSPVRTNG